MAEAYVRGLKLLKPGIKELLTSEPIETMLMDLAQEIVRDAETLSSNDNYSAEFHRVRKTRTVVNIVAEGEGTREYEAEFGHLARAARKQRGEV